MTPELTADSPGEASKQIPSTAGMTTKVVKGSMWTLAGQVAPLAVSLVTTPFVIRMLGAEGYGVFILIGLIPTYLAFADFGMSMASTKFASEAYAEGNTEKEARIVRTAALIALCSSVPVAALLMIFAGNIVSLFNVPAHLSNEATLALRIASVTFVVNILCTIINSPQLARLRMDLNSLVNASSRILGQVAVPIVLYFGFGLPAAIGALLIASVANLGFHYLASRMLMPGMGKHLADTRMDWPIFRFGAGFVVASVAAMLLVNAEKMILAATSSTTVLAYYSVAYTLASMTTLFTYALGQSLMPAFARLQAGGEVQAQDLLYSRALRLNLIWIFPMIVVLAIVARPFFSAWAGPDFGRESVLPLYALLIGVIFNLIAALPNTVLLAAGRTDILARLYWAELIPYALLVWLLSSRFGAVGAAIAWTVRVVADAVFQFALARRVVRVQFVDHIFVPLVLAIFVISTPFLYLLGFYNSFPIFIVSSLVSFGIYGALAFRFLLREEEASRLVSLVRLRTVG